MAEDKKNRFETGEPATGSDAEDAGSRIGSTHGAETGETEKSGYAREIGESASSQAESNRAARTRNSGLTVAGRVHPSRRLELRAKGYGIGGGYERPYRKDKSKPSDDRRELYGPMPHSGILWHGKQRETFQARGRRASTKRLAGTASNTGKRRADIKRRRNRPCSRLLYDHSAEVA